MKKLLSMALVVTMLSTMAFATDTSLTGKSAEDPYVNDSTTGLLDIELIAEPKNYVATGSKLAISAKDFLADNVNTLSDNKLDTAAEKFEFEEDYFSVSATRYIYGSDLVSATYFETVTGEGGKFVIELKKNIVLKDVVNPNFQIDYISVKAKKDSNYDCFYKNDTYTYTGHVPMYVVTHLGVVLNNDRFYKTLEDYNGEVMIFDFNGDKETYYEGQYEADEITLYGRLYDEDILLIETNREFDLEILKANPLATRVHFTAVRMDGFSTAWNILVHANEDEFLYEEIGGKLYDTTLLWSDDYYAYSGRIRDDVNYVISDYPLEAIPLATEEPEVEEEVIEPTVDYNPSTGRA